MSAEQSPEGDPQSPARPAFSADDKAAMPRFLSVLSNSLGRLMAWLSNPITPAYENSEKLAWMTRFRSIVICLQLLALLPGVSLGFVGSDNIKYYLAIIGSAILFNIASVMATKGKELSNTWVAWQLFFDVTQFSLLLALAGGWRNPFSPVIFTYAALGGAMLSMSNKFRLGFYIIVLIFLLQKTFAFDLVTNRPELDVWVSIAVDGVVVMSIMLLVASISRNLIRREKMLVEIKDRHLRMDRLRAIGTLSGAFCHQMATPINSIKLRANRLLRKSDQHASDLQNDIQSIFQSIQSCESVLKKLTNVHLDPDEVIFQDQDLSELIRTCVEIWQRELTPDNTKISLDLPDTAWLTLPGIMMTQAILDLLDNAYEAIDGSKESGHIWVSLKEHGNSLELVVADNGEGFPEHIRSRLGEPFNTSKPNGNGLGLYHASLLSELMGGQLRVGSRPDGGKGAAVTITFEKEKHVESRTTANFNR